MNNIVGQQTAVPLSVYEGEQHSASASIPKGVSLVPSDTTYTYRKYLNFTDPQGQVTFGNYFCPINGDYRAHIQTPETLNNETLLSFAGNQQSYMRMAADSYAEVTNTYLAMLDSSSTGSFSIKTLDTVSPGDIITGGATTASDEEHIPLNDTSEYIVVNNGVVSGFGNSPYAGSDEFGFKLETVLYEGNIYVNAFTQEQELVSAKVQGEDTWWRLQITTDKKIKYTSRVNGGAISTSYSTQPLNEDAVSYIKIYHAENSVGRVTFNVDRIENSETHSATFNTSADMDLWIGRDVVDGGQYSNFSLLYTMNIKGSGDYEAGGNIFAGASYTIFNKDDGTTVLETNTFPSEYDGYIKNSSVTTASMPITTYFRLYVDEYNRFTFEMSNGFTFYDMLDSSGVKANTNYTISYRPKTVDYNSSHIELLVDGNVVATTKRLTIFNSLAGDVYIGKNNFLPTSTGFECTINNFSIDDTEYNMLNAIGVTVIPPSNVESNYMNTFFLTNCEAEADNIELGVHQGSVFDSTLGTPSIAYTGTSFGAESIVEFEENVGIMNIMGVYPIVTSFSMYNLAGTSPVQLLNVSAYNYTGTGSEYYTWLSAKVFKIDDTHIGILGYNCYTEGNPDDVMEDRLLVYEINITNYAGTTGNTATLVQNYLIDEYITTPTLTAPSIGLVEMDKGTNLAKFMMVGEVATGGSNEFNVYTINSANNYLPVITNTTSSTYTGYLEIGQGSSNMNMKDSSGNVHIYSFDETPSLINANAITGVTYWKAIVGDIYVDWINTGTYPDIVQSGIIYRLQVDNTYVQTDTLAYPSSNIIVLDDYKISFLKNLQILETTDSLDMVYVDFDYNYEILATTEVQLDDFTVNVYPTFVGTFDSKLAIVYGEEQGMGYDYYINSMDYTLVSDKLFMTVKSIDPAESHVVYSIDRIYPYTEYVVEVDFTDDSIEFYINGVLQGSVEVSLNGTEGSFTLGNNEDSSIDYGAFLGRYFEVEVSGDSYDSSGTYKYNKSGKYTFDQDFQSTRATDYNISDGEQNGQLDAYGSIEIETESLSGIMTKTSFMSFEIDVTGNYETNNIVAMNEFELTNSSNTLYPIQQELKIQNYSYSASSMTYQLSIDMITSDTQSTYLPKQEVGTYDVESKLISKVYTDPTVQYVLLFDDENNRYVYIDSDGYKEYLTPTKTYCLSPRYNQQEIYMPIQLNNIVGTSNSLTETEATELAKNGVDEYEETSILTSSNSEIYYDIDYTASEIKNAGISGERFNLASANIELYNVTVRDSIPTGTSYDDGIKYTFSASEAEVGYISILLQNPTTGINIGVNDATASAVDGENGDVWISCEFTTVVGTNEISIWSTSDTDSLIGGVVSTKYTEYLPQYSGLYFNGDDSRVVSDSFTSFNPKVIYMDAIIEGPGDLFMMNGDNNTGISINSSNKLQIANNSSNTIANTVISSGTRNLFVFRYNDDLDTPTYDIFINGVKQTLDKDICSLLSMTKFSMAYNESEGVYTNATIYDMRVSSKSIDDDIAESLSTKSTPISEVFDHTAQIIINQNYSKVSIFNRGSITAAITPDSVLLARDGSTAPIGYTYINNQSYKKVAYIRNYISVDFARSWYDVGTFTITIDADNKDAGKLSIGNYIWLGDWIKSPEETSDGIGEVRQGIILSRRRKLTESNGIVKNLITIQGVEVKGLANYTIVLPPGGELLPSGQLNFVQGQSYDVYDDVAIEEIMASLILKNRYENNVFTFHNITNLELKYNSSQPRGEHISAEYRFNNLSDTLGSLGLLGNLGWGAYIDFGSNDKVTFYIREGQDLSDEITLRYGHGDLRNATYTEDGVDAVTQLIGGGQGEGNLRTLVTVGDFDSSGIMSKMDFADTRDVSTLSGVINKTEEVYASRNELNTLTVNAFTSAIKSNIPDDYTLGDTITVNIEPWGLVATYPIIKIRERFFPDNDGTVELTFGDGEVNVYDNIKYSLSNLRPEMTK